ncbi:inosine/xanthosine triphosphatase [Candidatus Bipolaricaulota bacterium]|nr:inosine/xanthosine triphosphatase [Candidatus Bipolaricaulota bacterium]
MKIGVGSTNPVKKEATEECFELIGEETEIERLDVNSGVSDQPTSDQEAITGAKNRARRVKKADTYYFSVGLEGSVSDTEFGMFLTGWSYLIDRDGKSYIGGGGRLKLPNSVASRIREGEELGPIMDEITGKEEVKRGPGAIGVFTDEIITRQSAYRNALVFALAKYLNPELYN